MNNIFKDCILLSSLPDISKWNTEKVQIMSGMFNGCKSLSSLPDISKWNIQNIKYKGNMSDMFKDTKIINIPEKFEN